MATSIDTVRYIEDQLASLGSRIRTHKMFGEYAVYYEDKVVALICDNQVFVKITPEGREIVGGNYQEGFPYPGAKPAILVDDEIINNHTIFTHLVEVTAQVLPLPKSKKSRHVR